MPVLLRSRSLVSRSRLLSRSVLAALALFALTACAKTTVVVLVRHAEPSNAPPNDPVLDPTGVTRAQELANVLAGSGIAAVFHTQLNRSRQTADPVVAALNVPRIEVPIAGGQDQQNADSIAHHITSTFAGQNVLVVGHSTTLHLIQAALGVPNPLPISSNDFDNLFVVIRRGSDVPARVIRARYGQ